MAIELRLGSNRRILRDALRASAIDNWRVLAALLGIDALGSVLLGALPIPTQLRWYLIGGGSAILAAVAAAAIYLGAGEHNRLLGELAESSTEDLLSRGIQRLRGWRSVRGLYFARHGDVDHVVIGPHGIWAVETKWVARSTELANGHLNLRGQRSAVAQAVAGARKVELVLRYGRQRLDVSVKPLVILWGPGSPEILGGFEELESVVVVEGRRGRAFRRHMLAGTSIPRATRVAAHQVLCELELSQRRRVDDARAHG